MRLTFLFAAFAAANVLASDYSASLYSENLYLSRESAEVSSVRVRANRQVSDYFSPYVQVGNELAITGGTIGSVESSYSFAYAAPGFSTKLGPVTFYGEARFRHFYDGAEPNAEGQGSIDIRGLLVYGDFFSKRVAETLSTDLFAEIYSEGVFTSADLNNVVLTGIGRFGGRISPFSHGYVDLFLETFLTFDRLGHYYYNHADLRPTLRMQYATDHFSIGLSASYMLTYYFPYATFDPNPYLSMPPGFRTMLVVGGSL